MLRCPNPYEQDGEIELRQLFELSDFEMTEETRAQHAALAAKLTTRARGS